jgi:hypothetical protein
VEFLPRVRYTFLPTRLDGPPNSGLPDAGAPSLYVFGLGYLKDLENIKLLMPSGGITRDLR